MVEKMGPVDQMKLTTRLIKQNNLDNEIEIPIFDSLKARFDSGVAYNGNIIPFSIFNKKLRHINPRLIENIIIKNVAAKLHPNLTNMRRDVGYRPEIPEHLSNSRIKIKISSDFGGPGTSLVLTVVDPNTNVTIYFLEPQL